MPELTTISNGTVLAARAFKRIGETIWVNTYELLYEGASAPADAYTYLDAVADAISVAESNIHSNKVYLDRVVISSVEPDSVPYNPSTFAVFSYNFACTGITGIHTLLPLSFCVLVKKLVNFGRAGNILYRGALSTTSGTMGAQGFTLDFDEANRITNALQTLINSLQALDTSLALVKLTDTGVIDNVRKVTGVTVRTLTTTKKLYNRYFDIANSSGSSGGQD